MAKAKSVFISSTSNDLHPYREEVKEAILRLEMRPIDMAYFGSQPGDAVDVSLEQVRKSDIFVGIIAHRYGYIPEGMTKSVTHQEYDEALKRHIPCLMYLIDPAHEWPETLIEDERQAQEKLTAFKAQIEKETVRSLFTTPDDLAQQVTVDIARLDQTQRQHRVVGRVAIIIISLMFLVALALLIDTGLRGEVTAFLGLARPERMPAGFNVVVAGFGFQQADGPVIQASAADDISDIVYGAVAELPEVDNLLGWRDNGVEHILAATSSGREQQAAQLAETLGADIVVYGLVKNDGLFNFLQPEFYITAEFAALQPELAGADSLGTPIEFLSNSDDWQGAVGVQERLNILRLFLRGLALYITGDFAESRQSFEDAAAIESRGLEVLYIFAGNAAVREQDFEDALALYSSTLDARPEYSRGLAGRGSALFQLAGQAHRLSPAPYDPDRHLAADVQCNQDMILPTEVELLVEWAVICYREALASPDRPETADMDVKIPFLLGQVYVWRSTQGYGDYWDEAQQYLTQVIGLYERSDSNRQARIRLFAAHAHYWVGLRLVSEEGSNHSSLEQALNDYEQAVELLQNDVNRVHNQQWIDFYTSEVEQLQRQLAE